MTATDRARKVAERGQLRPMALFKVYRKSSVPVGGWSQEVFHSGNGALLLEDISAVVRAARLRSMRALTELLSQIMGEQVDRTIEEATALYGRAYGTTNDTTQTRSEYLLALWLLAMQQAISSMSMEVALTLTPAIQSVVDDIYRKAMLLLGTEPNRVQVALMTNRARDIATSLQSVVETTVDRMQSTIEKTIIAGGAMSDVLTALQSRKGVIATNRVGTILRTELGKAADEATLSAYKDSGVVSHVSVVGCQAIEPGIPTFAGVPTCNIQNVPIQDMRRLKFHPNHTGMIVPSAFYNKDGSAPKLTVRRGSV